MLGTPEIRDRRTDAIIALKSFLIEMSRRTEKDPPEYFVGRQAEIDSILYFRDHWTASRSRMKAASHIVSGAPGAGKTSFNNEIAERWEERHGATAILLGNPAATEEEKKEAYLEIAVALGALGPKDLLTTNTSEGGGGLNVAGVANIKGGYGSSEAPPKKPGSLLEISGLPNYSEDKARQRRVVVLIDEIQNIRPDSPGADFIKDLHNDQQQLPILLVCSGLADSEIKLDEAGATRFARNHIHRIGALSELEAINCVTKYLQAAIAAGLSARADVVETWAKRIAQESDQWPRHIHCYLVAAWQSLLDMPSPNLNECDIDAAMKLGDVFRRDYYAERIMKSKVDKDIIKALVAEVEQAEPDGLSKSDATKIIYDAANNLHPTVKEDYDQLFGRASNCLLSLLHAGVVTHSNNQIEPFFTVPIPTMTDYIMGRKPSTPKQTPESQTATPEFIR